MVSDETPWEVGDTSSTEMFDRELLKSMAADRVDTQRREHLVGDISVPELVRSFREIEDSALLTLNRGECSRDFALGMWTAFAAVRYDFGIEDSRYVDTGGEPP